ncbi:DUF1659 domain-containing protein [Thermosediminibacter litoriperuensis]|uniref:Uncharacterized protein DUF1659 n=1 Tax=Thermosediminibacter litoriperuensis TaxID=291989 RepID=A0A5S5AR63_9FIRM|nr:DUF1659 domain-containing protein [Thermosediminibacter litoriperuensis]TYP53800.1 uncharacterized protein DUF1659 [Thermosediminibacter litoriperuensis]
MAVIATPVEATLQVVVQTGTGENGRPVTRTRSFRNLKTSAPDADVMELAKALAGLQIHPVDSFRKVVEIELTEE